jgi:hypothetical protein
MIVLLALRSPFPPLAAELCLVRPIGAVALTANIGFGLKLALESALNNNGRCFFGELPNKPFSGTFDTAAAVLDYRLKMLARGQNSLWAGANRMQTNAYA